MPFSQEKMPSVRAPQSAKATESKALKRKLFDDGNGKSEHLDFHYFLFYFFK